MKFVVGLGNPGKRYANTRHNVGFLVLDRLSGGAGAQPPRRLLKCEYREQAIEGHRVLLVKPQTYMNLSGPAVQGILDFFKGSRDDLLVVHDDLDLPWGRLRFRARGSSGGHRGLASILGALGEEDVQRLKIGIGRDPQADPAAFVLAPLGAAASRELERIVDGAADAVRTWIRSGIDRSANIYNAGEKSPGKTE